MTALEILLEDPFVLVVVKPAGLLTQENRWGGPTLVGAIQAYLDQQATITPYLGTIHRLDRLVSGVMVFAKTRKVARQLSRQFEHRRTLKHYWAIVEGRPEPSEGVWNDWLCEENTGLGVVQVVHKDTPRARQAITRFATGSGLRCPEGCAWLRLWPETGRTHQLRVQAAHRGIPIVGDRAYGSTRDFPQGIALHARSLSFEHPDSKQPMTFEASLPAAWKDAGILVEPSP